MSDYTAFLEANYFVDADHEVIRGYARSNKGPDDSPHAQVRHLYYAIRDGFYYNPWRVIIKREAFKASSVLLRNRDEGAHCIDKANLMAACARVLGIPSRLHFANVRNHIGSESLERQLGTDLLVFHGYVELFLQGGWVAATPAFNVELCEHLNVPPLEFDGVHDSIFQEYDRSGGRFMEYVVDHGHFPTIPYDMMVAAWDEHYPDFANGWPQKPAK